MTPALLADQTHCVDGTEAVCSVATTVAKRELSGWYIKQARSGEKGLSTPLVDAGRVFFTSYRPGASGGSCGVSEGEGSVYIVNLADGTAVNNDRFFDIGPGIPPGAILIGDVILIPGAGIDLDAEGDGEITKLPKSLTRKLYQIYWREPGIDQL
jgi:type IV pilus assembly protein PilY1